MTITKQVKNQASITTDTFPKEAVERAIKENKIIVLNIKNKKEEKAFVEKVNRAIIDPGNELTLPESESIKRHFSTSLPRTVNRLEYEKGDFLNELDKYIDIDQWEKKNNISLPKDEGRSKYSYFYTLHIKNLRKSEYDSVVADKLNKLKNKIENKRFKEFTVGKESDREKVERVGSGYLLKHVEKVKLEKYSQCLQPNQFVMLRDGYKVVMEIIFPSIIIISFLNGDAPNEFIKEFQGEIVEIPPSEQKADFEKEVALVQEKPQEEVKDKYIFRKEDENYFIQYENEEFKPVITDGLKYMEHLLKNPYPKHFFTKTIISRSKQNP